MKKVLYEELADQFIQKIDCGEWAIGTKLPGEIELAHCCGGGRSTVREALNLLVERGMVQKKNGVGTFVISKTPTLKNPLANLNSVGEMIQSAGCRPHSVFYKIEHCKPEPEIRELFDLTEEEAVVVMSRGRVADQIPVAFSYNIYPEKYVGNLFDEGVNGKIFQLLEQNCGIHIRYADTQIQGSSLKREWDRNAKDFLNSSIVLLKQLHYDSEGRKIFCSYDYLNTDIINLNLRRELR